jgi:hypothetical protein
MSYSTSPVFELVLRVGNGTSFPRLGLAALAVSSGEEWAPKVKADPVQGLTASQRRELFFVLGKATWSVPFRFGDGNDFRCFAHARS